MENPINIVKTKAHNAKNVVSEYWDNHGNEIKSDLLKAALVGSLAYIGIMKFENWLDTTTQKAYLIDQDLYDDYQEWVKLPDPEEEN